jgi:hypothetical protein
MSESFFEGIDDIDEIPDNPNELPNNTYEFEVIHAEYGPTKAGDKVGISFKYQILRGAYSSFYPLSDWVQIADSSAPVADRKRMLSWLKNRLLAWGFTPEEMRTVASKDGIKDTIGRKFYGTTRLTKQNDGNPNIRVVKFDPIDTEDSEDLLGDSDNETPF